jgi:hypothetical protein
MKNKLMPLIEKILLRKRSIIEIVFSVLKGTFEIEHTRHRSVWNAFTFTHKPPKPIAHLSLLPLNILQKRSLIYSSRFG